MGLQAIGREKFVDNRSTVRRRGGRWGFSVGTVNTAGPENAADLLNILTSDHTARAIIGARPHREPTRIQDFHKIEHIADCEQTLPAKPLGGQ